MYPLHVSLFLFYSPFRILRALDSVCDRSVALTFKESDFAASILLPLHNCKSCDGTKKGKEREAGG